LRYLDAPALVVIEVEVKSIESVRRNLIDQPTDRLDVEEMTSHVQVNTAPREARPVFNEERGSSSVSSVAALDQRAFAPVGEGP